ncbi:MAG TPA: glycosyltransferase family 4 protein [Mycobacteriales bacterium]|nr:glycosyltransferase family 4 protein [Mycobacteriales bacterium]
MRIAVVHAFTWADVRRGGERYAHDLAWWLASQGHEVEYVAAGPAYSVTYDGAVRMVRLHHRHGERLTGWGFAKSETFGVTALPWLLRHRYDVVVAFAPGPVLAARAAGQRVVFSEIGHPTPQSAGRAAMRRRAMLSAHVVTALSRSAAEGIAALCGRMPTVVNPGVRTDVFTPNIAPRTGPPRLLFAAHAGSPYKRLGDLLDAMPRVLEALPDARLVFAGPGALPDGIPDGVRAAIDDIGAGRLEDVPQRYRDATVTVLASEEEAFGLVLAESLACGTPVVGADAGGIPEIVVPAAGVGALAPLGDTAALADAIIRTVALARDPETPVRCVQHAQQWSWDAVGPRHLAAYQAAISSK